MTPIDPEREYTAKEAAELLGVLPGTIVQWVRRKKLAAAGRGRHLPGWHPPLFFRGSELIRARDVGDRRRAA